jgi:hypothetical protein
MNSETPSSQRINRSLSAAIPGDRLINVKHGTTRVLCGAKDRRSSICWEQMAEIVNRHYLWDEAGDRRFKSGINLHAQSTFQKRAPKPVPKWAIQLRTRHIRVLTL